MGNDAKIAFVKWVGPHKFFKPFNKDDPARRQKLNDEDAIGLFEEVYEFHKLQQRIEEAQLCDSEKAKDRIKASHRKYFDINALHREFRYLDLDFIVQIDPNTNDVTQIWPVKDSDPDPRILWIQFEPAEDKELFNQIAERFNYEGGYDLAKELIDDFVRKVNRPKRARDWDDEDIPF